MNEEGANIEVVHRNKIGRGGDKPNGGVDTNFVIVMHSSSYADSYPY